MKKVVSFFSVLGLLFCISINSIVYAEEVKDKVITNDNVEETKPEENTKIEENKEENKLEEDKKPEQNKEENKLEEDKKPDEKKPIIKLSDNNNIKEIKLSAGTINFDKYNLLYFIDVDDTVDEIDVEATLEDRTARIKGNGNYKLNYGENTINLEVTSQDRTTKTYILVINRKEKEIIVEPEIQPETNINDNKNNIHDKKILMYSGVGIATLVIAVMGVIIHVKKK